ncbi:hypothetical protein DSCW_20300 [Desulfosarcina widdelii]|uniref:TRAP C4-dicarboxylate transport system permease DctM subunit domain-containing protein n=1 Tax=Desulfosarcina widdelii TaxID=947919 RepID=A0A5K7Z3S2_9BACT|nr:hypothetical protein DSCW_20300 [Desulfosarcina widdelii]
MWAVTALVFVFLMILLMCTGLPVAFILLAIGFGGLCMSVGVDVALSILDENMYSMAANQSLATVPLFVLMGLIFLKSGIGEDLFMAVHKWLGRVPGSMAAASVGACGIFGAMCGSSTATTASIGTVAAPSMIKLGYDKGLSCGVVSAAGALGPVIPPSVYMIVYAVCAEESIGKLFSAAIVPGILLSALMILEVIVLVRMNSDLAPTSESSSWTEKYQLSKGLIVPVIIVIVVLGSIYGGIATPTEAAALGVSTSIIVAFITKRINLSDFMDALATTTSFSCMIMLLIIGGSLLSKLFAVELIPQKLGALIVGLPIHPLLIMVAIQMVIFVGGFVIEGCALIIILTPVFLPVIKALDFDPVVFGVAFMINLAMAVITPPFAVNLFVMKGVMPDVEFTVIAKGALKFVFADLAVLVLVILFPWVSLWLPSVMK